MKTQINGKVVIIEDGDDESKILQTLMCKCGHPLYLHSHIAWIPNTIHTSQCTACGFTKNNSEFICKQFEANNEE